MIDVNDEFAYPSEDDLWSICFPRDAFESLMEHFDGSPTLVRMIHTHREETLFYSSDIYEKQKRGGIEPGTARDPPEATKQVSKLGENPIRNISIIASDYRIYIVYNLRTEKTYPGDLALTVQWDAHSKITTAFLHGADVKGFETLKEWLTLVASSTGHPTLLPALLAELQYEKHEKIQKKYTDGFKSVHEEINELADKSIHPMGHHSYVTDAIEVKVEELTEKIFHLYLSAGNLRRRVLSFKSQLLRMKQSMNCLEFVADQDYREYLQIHTKRIGDRLDEISSEYELIIQQSGTVVEGASVLLSSVRKPISHQGFLIS